MPWTLSWRDDPAARALADRHYSRQTPGASGFVPPGRCLVLTRPGAYWVTSWPIAAYTHHAWAGAWVCSAFRLEGGEGGEASALIGEAIAATRWRYPEIPRVPAWAISRGTRASRVDRIEVAMVTMVDPGAVRAKRDPGRCFRRAGWVEVGRTRERGLLVLGLPVERVPEARAPVGAQGALFAA